MTIDALGNPIVIGEHYGYSSSGQSQRVVVGQAVAVSGYKAQIKPITTKEFMYGEPYVQSRGVAPTPARVITVAGFLLFPVQAR